MTALPVSPDEQPTLDQATAIDRNLVLAGELLQAQLENPELLAEIPNGATLIFNPEADPALAEYNFGLARAALARGANVYLKRVPATGHQPIGPKSLILSRISALRVRLDDLQRSLATLEADLKSE